MAMLTDLGREMTGLGQEDWPREITQDVAYLRTAIVNVVMVGLPLSGGDRNWVLVDAGMPGYAGTIRAAAAKRFGAGSRPSAIVLTHGHFDHVGGLEELAKEWDAPIYAHDLEFPYLTGRSPYPPPDPAVGGGLMAALSFLYPRGPIDVSDRLQRLPGDGAVPGMPGWRWVPTPGHTPGHVSFFRDSDRMLIVGDAFTTVKQESALAVLTQAPEVHGPPAYYTPDWGAAWRSVEALQGLSPAKAVTGHGVPLVGHALDAGLRKLADAFDRLAIPARGRYVGHPAVMDETGVVSVPPDVSNPWPRLAGAAGVGVGVGLALAAALPRRGKLRR